MVDSKVRLQTTIITRLNMLFIPTLPVKAELIAMLRMLCNAVPCCAMMCNAVQCCGMLKMLSNAEQH